MNKLDYLLTFGGSLVFALIDLFLIRSMARQRNIDITYEVKFILGAPVPERA